MGIDIIIIIIIIVVVVIVIIIIIIVIIIFIVIVSASHICQLISIQEYQPWVGFLLASHPMHMINDIIWHRKSCAITTI
jgi:hypothetical protein